MRFLHAADVHLGAEPESGSPLGAIRRREIWDAFRDIIEICEQQKIDLLLLPGDLFHGQPLLREVKEVDALFRSLTHTKVVLCAGNHDCLLSSSHYYDVSFPEHVAFLTDAYADSVYFPELNTEVFGLSYETKQISEARYDSFRINHPSRINILIAHGNLMCNDKSIPIHREAIEAAGFDYAALGHVHTRFEISTRIAYSGNLEPLNKGDTDPKGYILGEIKKEDSAESKISWNFVPHAGRQYISLQHEVTAETTELSLCNELMTAMQEQGLCHMYLITLTGMRAREVIWEEEAIASGLNSRGANVIEIKDETVPDFCVEQLRTEQKDTLVGRFIRRMDEEEDRELAQMALQYGLQALLALDERK